ncbi:MAG: hypothetical protein FJ083_18365 [Cyanobacteria bacterium K_Offshore_surface_m2_239]|nr:hypothetical protein [Cyanobacteria bacterium K_Offshore_surface_m2_239]
MRGRWRNGALALTAVLAAVGFARNVLVLQPPAAAALPKTLQLTAPRLRGQASQKEPIGPPQRGRDVALGPAHRYRLGPGEPHLELVARRSRSWDGMAPETLKGQRLLRLGPREQVALGRLEGKSALRTCLVGRGRDEREPSAAVEEAELNSAVIRWRGRLDWPPEPMHQLWRALTIQAGARVSERWECLRVTLVNEASDDQPTAEKKLVPAWRTVRPQLAGWGEHWEGVNY